MSYVLPHKHNNRAADPKTSTVTRTSKPPNKKKDTFYNISTADSSSRIIHLQKSIGNQAVQKLMHANSGFDSEIGIQTKLKMSCPGDAYEQEAEKVADQLMKMSSSESNPKLFSSTSNNKELDRKKSSEREMKEKKEKINISKKPSSNSSDLETSDEITNQVSDVRADSSLLLESSTKEFMESKFGHAFSKVRIHTGEMANRSANAVNAIAYTVGNDIVFGEGQYRPDTLEGRKLLAHELTHVVQQSNTNTNNNNVTTPLGLNTLSSAERISRQKATKGTSAEELEKQFQQAILKSDWTHAVDRLAAFSITDIPKLLERYVITQSELDLLKKAALSKFGSDESRMVPAINGLIESKK
jgi:hypothetical protein